MRARLARGLIGAVGAIVLLSPSVARASSVDALVESAKRAEAVHEEDIAARRYTEALALDGTSVEGWMGLGALRERQGDLREAERVYAACLSRLPGHIPARLAHGEALHGLGRTADAIAEIELVARVDARERRRIATWYADDGLYPAALATWRTVLTRALDDGDTATASEARAMVRAFVLFAKPLDPAAFPSSTSHTRRSLSRIAKTGG